MFIGRTDAEAETPVLWPPDMKSWLVGKDLDAGRHWGQEEKGMTEDEMAGWHHWLYGHEFEKTLGAGDGQGGLACCDSWGRKESDMTELLNWTELISMAVKKKINVVETGEKKSLRYYRYINWNLQGRYYGITKKKKKKKSYHPIKLSHLWVIIKRNLNQSVQVRCALSCSSHQFTIAKT